MIIILLKSARSALPQGSRAFKICRYLAPTAHGCKPLSVEPVSFLFGVLVASVCRKQKFRRVSRKRVVKFSAFYLRKQWSCSLEIVWTASLSWVWLLQTRITEDQKMDLLVKSCWELWDFPFTTYARKSPSYVSFRFSATHAQKSRWAANRW